MDMVSFFRRIIPSEGFKYLIEFTPEGKPHHYVFDDFDLMVEKVNALIPRNRAIYHACSSYTEVKYNEFSHPVGRTQGNVKLVKALWQDIDVGKRDKTTHQLKPDNYESKEHALAALKAMLRATGMPTPMLVDSGNGLHCYWPFTEAVTPVEWRELALLARFAMQHAGFKFDTSRDVDSASILRPIGTFNKGKPVVLKYEGEEKPYAYYKELLTNYQIEHGLVVPSAKPLENEFAGPAPEYPPSDLAIIAEHCSQIRNFKETGGSTEPLWFASLGLAKHCVNGAEIAHDWSAKYPDYSFEETQKKMDGWSKGPTTCETFASRNPAGCKDCPFADIVKSPIQLGYKVETETPKIDVVQPDGTVVKEAIPFWPPSFVRLDNFIQYQSAGDDGVITYHKVCSPPFYFKDRIRGEDGTFIYKVRVNTRNAEWHEFEMPVKHLADSRSFKTSLAAHEIMADNDKLLGVWGRDWSTRIRKYQEEISTFSQFGWNENKTSFLIGNSLVHKGGRTEVRVSNVVVRDRSLLKAGIVKGSKQIWVEGVKELYDREYGEPYQYAICAQFGAPLVSFMDYAEWNGIPMALTSEGTGYGKSTVVKIGINALCNSAITTVTTATPKGVIGRASAMNNLPMLVDEITHSLVNPEDIMFVLYSLANGGPTIGMGSDGMERIPLPHYKLGSTLTGNRNLNELLASAPKINPEATQMRLFEIYMSDYPRMKTLLDDSELHAEHHELTQVIINECHGVFSDDYVNFVIDHQQEIKEKLQSIVNKITRILKGNAAKERFLIYHLAQTLVGGWIGTKIGAISFNLDVIKRWGFDHIIGLRAIAKKFDANVEDRFSQFLADLHGSILVTKHFDLLDAKKGHTEMPMLPLRGPINARLVLGSDKERGKLFVAVKALDDWCGKNKTVATNFKRQLASSNLLRLGGAQGKGFDKKISIGRGVPAHPLGQCRCFEFDYAAAQGYIEEFIKDNVVPIVSPQQPAATAVPASPAQQVP